MEFVDTHCHLNFHAYNDDLDRVIERADTACVHRIVIPGLDLLSSHQAVALAGSHNQVFAAVGIHPEEVDSYIEDNIHVIENLLANEKVVGIGEIGLDYYHRKDRVFQQKELLRTFLKMAIKHQKPVILHSRESLKDLIQVISEELSIFHLDKMSGIFHAFEGDLEDATKVIEMGFFIGVGGPITYKNAIMKHEVFSKIDLTSIVLETDGPFLTPQTFRGKRNEPSYIPLIAEKLAELKHCDIKEVADITTENAKKLFKWT